MNELFNFVILFFLCTSCLYLSIKVFDFMFRILLNSYKFKDK